MNPQLNKVPLQPDHNRLLVRPLGMVEYEPCWKAMKEFTLARTDTTPDEIWLVEHPPVYTVGQNLKAAHMPFSNNGIPLVRTDRGGDITYHGPGQAVIYTMIDLRRMGLGIKHLVHSLEEATIRLLSEYDIQAQRREHAPGVYVNDRKVASLGLRIKQGRSYHGLALNCSMDLSPFENIAPCGYQGLRVTQLAELTDKLDIADAHLGLLAHLGSLLGYTETLMASKAD